MNKTNALHRGWRWLVPALLVVAFVMVACSGTPTTPAPSPTSIGAPVQPSPTSAPTATPGHVTEPTSTPRPTLTPTPTPLPLVYPTPTPEKAMALNFIWRYPPSLDEQILDSEFIIRATLQSATAGTLSVPSDPGVEPTYRATQVLTFNVHEYLKGRGPLTLAVTVVGRDIFITEMEAKSHADNVLLGRNTQWDNRQAIVFVRTSRFTSVAGGASGDSGQPSKSYELTTSNPYVKSEWDYTITSLDRAWLPAVNEPIPGSSSRDAPPQQEFITDGSQSPPPTSTLAQLRTRISEIDALFAAGEGTEGYDECIEGMLLRERYYRDWEPSTVEKAMESGMPAGHAVYRIDLAHLHPAYSRDYVSGANETLFEVVVIDDNDNPTDGYSRALRTTRPLPAGLYNVRYNAQHYSYIPCNFKPEDGYTIYAVTVTPAANVVHEALFDPATLTAGVGADGTTGKLSDTSFTIGGTTSSLAGLKWESGSATLTLSAHVSLAGHRVDIMETDGTVSRSLLVSSATENASARTYTWETSQPWHDGDKLLVQILPALQITLSVDKPTPAAAEPVTLTATVTNGFARPQPSFSWELGFGDTWLQYGDGPSLKTLGNPGETVGFRVTVTYSNGFSLTSAPLSVTWP